MTHTHAHACPNCGGAGTAKVITGGTRINRRTTTVRCGNCGGTGNTSSGR